jgi:hypothetical protein
VKIMWQKYIKRKANTISYMIKNIYYNMIRSRQSVHCYFGDPYCIDCGNPERERTIE